MSERKEDSFVKGAIILAVSSILVKVIGAVFRIPLTNLVGDYSMGLYSVAYRYYSIFLTIATAGIPIAISKMVSESRALGRGVETKNIFRNAMYICSAIGLIGAILLFFFCDNLALSTNDINAAASIKALSPAVFFMAVTAAFRGYFQGHKNMVPTGVSQIIEAASRLCFGLAFAWILLRGGFAEKYVSVGAISGVTIGTVLSAGFMLAVYLRNKRTRGEVLGGTQESRKDSELIGALLLIAIPVTIGSLVMNVTSFVDMFLITNRLASLGYESKTTTSLYGIYESMALPIFNMIPSVIISLNTSVTPAISSAYAVRDMKTLNKTLLSALRIVIIFTLPAAVGITALANPILSVLYSSETGIETAAPVLAILGIASFFLCASSLTSTAMQALGYAGIPVLTMLAGAAVKIALNYFLIAVPGIELMGASIGTVACYVVIFVLNMICLARIVGFKPPLAETYLRPMVSSAVMGVAVLLIYKLASIKFGNLISTFAAIAVGVAVYAFMMFKTGGITKEDVLNLPKGEKIASFIYKK